MIRMLDFACARCRVVFDDDDERPWAVDGRDVLCGGCVSPADEDRSVVASMQQTTMLHVAAGHPAAVDQALGVLERYVEVDDKTAVFMWLRALADSPIGHDAVAWLAYALLVTSDC